MVINFRNGYYCNLFLGDVSQNPGPFQCDSSQIQLIDFDGPSLQNSCVYSNGSSAAH